MLKELKARCEMLIEVMNDETADQGYRNFAKEMVLALKAQIFCIENADDLELDEEEKVEIETEVKIAMNVFAYGKDSVEPTKEFLDCKNIRECVEWYLEKTKGKERDAEFDLGFIASLYDNHYWDLEEEVLEIERKRRINQVIEWAQ